jgi:amino acid permease
MLCKALTLDSPNPPRILLQHQSLRSCARLTSKMSVVETDGNSFGGPLQLPAHDEESEPRSVESMSTTTYHDIRSFIAHQLFDKDRLDRKLKRHHITCKLTKAGPWYHVLMAAATAIAFSGTVGMGLFVTSGQLISISGSGGCVISFAVAGCIIIAVMRTLAEMVSVRPLSGALIDFPHTFVDPALGFAVGVMYW